MLLLGVALLFQYLLQVVTAYAAGRPPATLEHYTTLELAALELGIMVPLHIVGGASLWRIDALVRHVPAGQGVAADVAGRSPLVSRIAQRLRFTARRVAPLERL
jgi:hypothetical protein